MSSAGDPGTGDFEKLQSQETPNLDVTKLLSNAAIVAAGVAIIEGVYFFATGKKLSGDQVQALTQILPAVGLLFVAFSVKRGKDAAYRASGKIAAKQEKVTQVLVDHLKEVGAQDAAAQVEEAMGQSATKLIG